MARKLSAHQRHLLAQGLAAGSSPAQIASGLQCQPSVVEDLIRNDPDIAKRRDAVAAMLRSKIAESKREMAEYLRADAAMDGGSIKAECLKTADAIIASMKDD